MVEECAILDWKKGIFTLTHAISDVVHISAGSTVTIHQLHILQVVFNTYDIPLVLVNWGCRRRC